MCSKWGFIARRSFTGLGQMESYIANYANCTSDGTANRRETFCHNQPRELIISEAVFLAVYEL